MQQANVKDARKLIRAVVLQLNARPEGWRDRHPTATPIAINKTSKKFPLRRSICFYLANGSAWAVLEACKKAFAEKGYNNILKVGNNSNGIRCIADL